MKLAGQAELAAGVQGQVAAEHRLFPQAGVLGKGGQGALGLRLRVLLCSVSAHEKNHLVLEEQKQLVWKAWLFSNRNGQNSGKLNSCNFGVKRFIKLFSGSASARSSMGSRKRPTSACIAPSFAHYLLPCKTVELVTPTAFLWLCYGGSRDKERCWVTNHKEQKKCGSPPAPGLSTFVPL